MTTACAEWMADDALVRAGYTITVYAPDRRVAACPGRKDLVLPPACGCGPDDCPPVHRAPEPRRDVLAEAPW